MIKVNYDEKTGKVISFGKDTKPYIEITEEERKQPLPNRYSFYAVRDGKFVIASREITDEDKAKDALIDKHKRLKEIEAWFRENDWKINKLFLGEWKATDTRWIKYLAERAAMRKEHEALTKED